jgi:hypothetical protein
MFQDTFQLHKDEYVLIYIRRHWLFLAFDFIRIFTTFLAFAFIIWGIQWSGVIGEFNVFGVSFYSLTDIFIYLWAIFCWLYMAEKFTDYALDFWVVTNKRILESELVKLFDRRLSTLELQDIEDITIQNKGLISNYFNYGNLEVQTAGTKREFYAERVANPEKIQKIIFDAKLKESKEAKDIEKGEIEQIATRLIRQDGGHIPSDQKVAFSEPVKEVLKLKNEEYDWAHISEKQAKDIRNLQEKIEEIEGKYKKNIDAATRYE